MWQLKHIPFFVCEAVDVRYATKETIQICPVLGFIRIFIPVCMEKALRSKLLVDLSELNLWSDSADAQTDLSRQ